MANPVHTASSISDLLNRRVADVAKMLVPAGKEETGQWVFGNASGAAGGSAKLHMNGPHVGQWRDWANDTDHGDLIDLWASVRGVSIGQAIRDAKEWLGIRDPAPYRATTYALPKPTQTVPLSPQGRALAWFRKERLITDQTVAAFQVVGDGTHIIFPHISPTSQVVNRCFRKLAEKEFHYDKGCAPGMFGWQALKTRSSRAVLICEGQIDCMTWQQWGFDALSVYGGATNFNWIEYEWDNLAQFDTIYVSLDMDEAGRKASKTVCERLGVARCLEVTLPYKDANDCLLSGCTANDATKWIAAAKPLRLDGLIVATEIREQVHKLFFSHDEIERRYFSPALLKGRGGQVTFRNGDVIAWTGHAGHGKSTLLGFLATGDIGFRKARYFFASMEMKPEKVVHKMATSCVGSDPEPAKVDEFIDSVGPNLFFANVLGFITQDNLFQMMEYCCLRYGITAAVIDSFMAIEGLEEDFPKQGAFMSRLTQFAKQHDIQMHIIVHPKKGDESIAPSMSDLKGSSLLFNRADVILAVQRNMKKVEAIDADKPQVVLNSMPDSYLFCRKDRETGWKGKIELFYDWRRNMYRSFTAPDPDEPPPVVASEHEPEPPVVEQYELADAPQD